MAYLAIVTVLALLQFQIFGFLVGRARARYNVPAPATTGNDIFERCFRAHMNTLEQLVVLLPALWIFGYYVSEVWAAGLGALWIVARVIYWTTYIQDAKKRSAGFALTFLPTLVMMIGILVWAVRALTMAG